MTRVAASPSVRVGLLGPLTLHVDGELVAVPGRRRRTLLAALALAPRRALTHEQLVDLTWPADPPEDAVQALYNHVSRLRGHLGPAADRLVRTASGYALDLADDEVDVRRARRVADGLAGRPPAEVVALAREALGLWQGPALEEFRGHPDLTAQCVALDELRVRLRDDLTEARLAVGEPAVAVDAAAAVAEEPLRERTALLLVRALAREGRTAEAMAAAAAFRQRLAEATGLDPGPGLAALEQEVAAGRLAPQPLTGPAWATVARPVGPLVGRDRDREEVRRLLAEHRVVTLTGAGGVGKTRLALEVAADLAEAGTVGDAVVVDLAAVEDAARVPQAVGSTLRLRTDGEVRADDVAAALGDARLLLVLDNGEHVVEACRELVDAVAARVPGVRVLSTSRIVLHARGEYVVRLQPLPVPGEAADVDSLEHQPSVRAFVEHARRHDRAFALGSGDTGPLVEVLRRLDGLPLAIEIAASHAAAMPIATLRDRLALDLAAGGSSSDDDRHATLRATIRWSYGMLAATDRALLRALAPFPGGVDLATVEVLAGETLPGEDPLRSLRRLVDASLVDVDPDRTRYRLLFTVRTFLLDELDREGSRDAAEERFVRWGRDAAARIGADLLGEREAAADLRLRAELANLRAARDGARARGDVDTVVAITLSVDQPSLWRDLREPWAWCLELADEPGVVGHPRAAEVLGAAAEAARVTGDYERAVELARRGLAVGGSAHDLVRCESALAAVAHYRGDFATAARRWRAAGEQPGGVQAGYLASAALAAGYLGDAGAAAELLGRAAALAEAQGCLGNLAFTDYVAGELAARDDPAVAIPAYESAIARARSVGAGFVAGVASVALASLRTRGGDRATAAGAFAELLDTWHATGQAPQLWTTARNAAALLLAEGRGREAVLLTTHAERSPEAAAVDDEIADRSGRTHLALDEAVDPLELDALRREAAAMPVRDVLDAARRALLELAAGD